jgi:hypothetical protein
MAIARFGIITLWAAAIYFETLLHFGSISMITPSSDVLDWLAVAGYIALLSLATWGVFKK